MELVILSTFFEDESQNKYERFFINDETYVVLVGQLLDSGVVDFMEENGNEFRFFDPLNEEGWDLSKGSLDLCYDIHLPKTSFEIVLTIPDDEKKRKLKLFFETGEYYIQGEGHLLW